MICTLPPKDSSALKTRLLLLKDSDPIEKTGLDFRVVNKFIPFNTLQANPELIEIIYRSETEIDTIIWDNKK